MITLRFNFKAISKDNEKSFNKRGIPFLSDKYRIFENMIKQDAMLQYTGKPITSKFQMIMQFHFKDKRHCDLFNLPKSISDALQGIVYVNDRQGKEGIIKVYDENETQDYFDVIVQPL